MNWGLIKLPLYWTESWALSPRQDSVFLFFFILFSYISSDDSSQNSVPKKKHGVSVPVSGTLGGTGPKVSTLEYWLEWPQAILAAAPPLGRPWQLGDPATLHRPSFCYLLCCCLNKTSHQQCLLQDLSQGSPNRTIDTQSDNLVSSNQSS